jgi:GNAT superfamily N-acetyltransferase
LALIDDGGAVNLRTMTRDLPRSQIVVIACLRGEVVGVGAIKPVREEYAAGIAGKSGYAFPPKTSELGYVVVEPAHRGHGLSHAITELLLKQHTSPLFATTDSPKMKKTLAAAGFRQEGKEWQGERGILSFWERK